MSVQPRQTDGVSWEAVETSLIRLARSEHAHLISPWAPTNPRRAAVAVVLWGDALRARELVLVKRGASAPHHPGELALPGGMAEREDRDLPATARRELAEELGLSEGLWELGCLPDGVAKARTRFTPVVFRWEAQDPHLEPGPEIASVLRLDVGWLLQAPWRCERLQHQGIGLTAPRLDLEPVPLWGATALVVRTWLEALGQVVR